jgi:hypothetical protein
MSRTTVEYRLCASCRLPAVHTSVWWFGYGFEPQCLCSTCSLLGVVFNEDGTVRDPRRRRRAAAENDATSIPTASIDLVSKTADSDTSNGTIGEYDARAQAE